MKRSVQTMAGILAVCIATILAGACVSAKRDSIYREYKINTSETLTSVLIDAKQRAIIAKRRVNSEGVATSAPESADLSGNQPKKPSKGPTPVSAGDEVVCAEPSPDVFTAISQSFASSGSFSGTSKEAQLALSYALAESAGELRRARTIQLLRDSLFNTCLGYMNGAMDGNEYQKLLNKYADETLTLLAVEQITPQAVTAPLTLTSQNATGPGSQTISNKPSPQDNGITTEKSPPPGTIPKPPSAPDDGGTSEQVVPADQAPSLPKPSQTTTPNTSASADAAAKNAISALSEKETADAALVNANKAVATAQSAVTKTPKDPAAIAGFKAALVAQANAAAKGASADKAASASLAKAIGAANEQAKSSKPAANTKSSEPSASKPKPAGAPAAPSSGDPNGSQAGGDGRTINTSNAPYPNGTNIQTLAPPTNAAVLGVQDMVHTFLNETLINKCLDNLNDSATDAGLPEGTSEDFKQRYAVQATYAVFYRNNFCQQLLNASFPNWRNEVATSTSAVGTDASSSSNSSAPAGKSVPSSKVPPSQGNSGKDTRFYYSPPSPGAPTTPAPTTATPQSNTPAPQTPVPTNSPAHPTRKSGAPTQDPTASPPQP